MTAPAFMGKGYKALPVRVAVTLRKKTAEGTYTDYAIPDCFRRFADQDYTSGGSAVLDSVAGIWHLWKEVLDAAGAPVPKVGDKIVDARGTFTIRHVETHNHGLRFRCTATRDRTP